MCTCVFILNPNEIRWDNKTNPLSTVRTFLCLPVHLIQALYISFKLSLSNPLDHPSSVLLTFLVLFTPPPLDFTLQDGACQGSLRSQPTSKPSDHTLRNDFQQDFVLTISSLTLLCISTHGVLLMKCTCNSILEQVFSNARMRFFFFSFFLCSSLKGLLSPTNVSKASFCLGRQRFVPPSFSTGVKK